jgi:hypothetical protein
MQPAKPHFAFAILAVLFLIPTNSDGFDTPLSDTAVREAYFLGQRHDLRCLDAYTKLLSAPQRGPHIARVTFLTPFAQVVQQSSARVGSYSAQQAQIDHRGTTESVKLVILINLTPSYSTVILPGDASNPKNQPVPRPHDFWRDFNVTISDGDTIRKPSAFLGHSNSSCGRRGPCALTGATLELAFPPESFVSDRAVIRITPPEMDPVVVEFNLISLR